MNSLDTRSPASGGARTKAGAPTGPIEITVVTASLNALEGLKQTIISVRDQTDCVVEHIVVDGGSTDGTVAYLQQLEDSIAFWQSGPDDGIADAMNKGLAHARGDYVLFLHAGDTFVDNGALLRATKHFGTGEDIVVFDVLIVGSRTHRSSSNALLRRLMLKPLAHQGVFCRRGLFARCGGFDRAFRVCMDYEFFLRTTRRGAKILRVPELLSRMPASGISSRTDWSSLSQRFAEERRAQLMHCPNAVWRIFYAVYWPLYVAYRRSRSRLKPEES